MTREQATADNSAKSAIFDAELVHFMTLYAEYRRESELHACAIERIKRMKDGSRNLESALFQKREAKARADRYKQEYIEQKQKLFRLYAEALVSG